MYSHITKTTKLRNGSNFRITAPPTFANQRHQIHFPRVYVAINRRRLKFLMNVIFRRYSTVKHTKKIVQSRENPINLRRKVIEDFIEKGDFVTGNGLIWIGLEHARGKGIWWRGWKWAGQRCLNWNPFRSSVISVKRRSKIMNCVKPFYSFFSVGCFCMLLYCMRLFWIIYVQHELADAR